MTVQEKLYTAQEFEAFIALPENTERRFELVNGEIIKKMPTQEHDVTPGKGRILSGEWMPNGVAGVP